MKNLCLFLKPQVTTAGGREKQREDIKTFIIPAITQAGLEAIDDQVDGLEVSDISDDIIQKIYKADVLIIDANWYETSGTFQLSPYLYYYMAIGHSLGNATILLANTTMHLPHSLIRYHTLTYSLAEIWDFIGKFKAVVEAIRQQLNSRPDNPIQDYLSQDALAKARQQIAEIEAEKARQRQSNQPIIFRRIE